jgi:sulfopyruvate decarboxylase TPP-binding subunit
VAQEAAAAPLAQVSSTLLDLLLDAGFDFFSGVPDSTLRTLLAEAEARPDVQYVPAVSEHVAVGLAAGAYLGGRRTALFLQNTGLALAINPLATLIAIYRLPLLLIVGWRGADATDSPEHRVIGATTLPLLEALRIPYFVPDAETLPNDLADAIAIMDAERSAVVVVIRPGVLA